MRIRVALACIAIVLFNFRPVFSQKSDAVLEAKTETAKLVFRGMVVSQTSFNTFTAIVRVVYKKPIGLSLDPGQVVYVFGEGEGLPQAGGEWIFFAKGWGQGQKLYLQEEERWKPSEVAEFLEKYRQETDRLEIAELVVWGKVVVIETIPHQLPSQCCSLLAIIEPREILKGHPLERIAVWFPAPDEAERLGMRRFRLNEEGVWILQQAGQRPWYFTVRLSDFLPTADVDRIRKFLK